jgi:Protein of unknown function (DUF2568)
MNAVKALNLGLRFGCEVAALVAVAWFGWRTTPVLAVVFPLLVAGVWGVGIAPRARRRWPDPQRFTAELVVFAAATAAFVGVGQAIVGVGFAVLAVVTAVLVRVWPEPLA